MPSPQVLTKGDASALLDSDRLVVTRGRHRTEIPLAAVQEARPDGSTAVEVVLTDGVVHRIEGENRVATASFVTALAEALPERRDPAGSALVTVTDEGLVIKTWYLVVGGLTLLLGWFGYAYWVGSAYTAEDAVLVFFSALPLLIGLVSTPGAVLMGVTRIKLARRGITVRAAHAGHYPNGKRKGYFAYTDSEGREHLYFSQRSAQYVDLVYDPRNPGDFAPRRPLFAVALGLLLLLALGLACLALGGAGVVVYLF
ncbi:hypothetical protein OG361_23160 [Streptomyces sp. NBC_00090]|uniref:hypothetical protein n=1 Tax=Streptomyces sp. NBC_00090 TaxID=2903619 RepID=UPI003249B99C